MNFLLLAALTLAAPTNQGCDPCSYWSSPIIPLWLNHCEAPMYPNPDCVGDAEDDWYQTKQDIDDAFCAFQSDSETYRDNAIADCNGNQECIDKANAEHENHMCDLEGLRGDSQEQANKDFLDAVGACPCIGGGAPAPPAPVGALQAASPWARLI